LTDRPRWARIGREGGLVQIEADVHVHAGGLSDEELRRAVVIPCRSIGETVARLRRHHRRSA